MNAALVRRMIASLVFADWPCSLPANGFRRPTGRVWLRSAVGHRLDSGTRRDCGRDRLHLVGIPIQRRRQERRIYLVVLTVAYR